MKPANLIALIVLLIGVACHGFGVTYTEGDQAEITHLVAGAIDLVGLGIAFFNRKKAERFSGGGSRIPAIVLAACLLAMSSGCVVNGGAMTAEQKLQAAQNTMTSVELGIMAAQSAEVIDAETAQELLAAGATVHALYQQLFDAYTGGEDVDFNDVHAAFNAALRAYLEQLEAKGVEPKASVSDGRGGGGAADPAGQRDDSDEDRTAQASYALRGEDVADAAKAVAPRECRDRAGPAARRAA